MNNTSATPRFLEGPFLQGAFSRGAFLRSAFRKLLLGGSLEARFETRADGTLLVTDKGSIDQRVVLAHRAALVEHLLPAATPESCCRAAEI